MRGRFRDLQNADPSEATKSSWGAASGRPVWAPSGVFLRPARGAALREGPSGQSRCPNSGRQSPAPPLTTVKAKFRRGRPSHMASVSPGVSSSMFEHTFDACLTAPGAHHGMT
jgi:hypothetical protein